MPIVAGTVREEDGTEILYGGPQPEYTTGHINWLNTQRDNNRRIYIGGDSRLQSILEFFDDETSDFQIQINEQNILNHHNQLYLEYATNGGINPQYGNGLNSEVWETRKQEIEDFFDGDETKNFQFVEIHQSGNGVYIKGTEENCHEDFDFIRKIMLPKISCVSIHKLAAGNFELQLHMKPSLARSRFLTAQVADFDDGVLPRSWLWYGAPGTGKSYGLHKRALELCGEEEAQENSKIYTVPFNPSTTYEDLFGEYLPQMVYGNLTEGDNENCCVYEYTKGDGGDPLPGQPAVNYGFVAGKFLTAYIEAKNDLDNNYVLLLDEINRADIYETLGELFQLIERKDDHCGEYDAMLSDVAMAYVNSKLNVAEEKIRLPDNLYIWATMNPNDTSVRRIDSAFMRRWTLKYISVDEKRGEENLEFGRGPLRRKNWDDVRSKINRELTNAGLDESKLIGEFFVSQNEISNWPQFYSKVIFHLANYVIKNRLSILFKRNTVQEIMADCKNGRSPFKPEVVGPYVPPERPNYEEMEFAELRQLCRDKGLGPFRESAQTFLQRLNDWWEGEYL
jgi:MoxR-like ATPase